MFRFAKTLIAVFVKFLVSLILIFLLVVSLTSVSAIYNFRESEPFKGNDIFNPYRDFNPDEKWKRANFHTHTRVEGILNECEHWPAEVLEAYKKFGYDIVTFSNHNQITDYPIDSTFYVNLYEHGYNLFKYHKLVFGPEKTDLFDHILPFFTSQLQYQLERLSFDSDIIQINHPLRTNFLTSFNHLELLEGYHIMELDSGKSTENQYWDKALSAGRYSFGLANDDLHYPDRSKAIAVRCNFIQVSSGRYEDIKKALLGGCYYSMRVPDYGDGNWEVKYEKNKNLPFVRNVGVKGDSPFIAFDRAADSIKVIGQNHTLLSKALNADSLAYTMRKNDTYARFIAYFPDGEVIYSNPFAHYDSSVAQSPFVKPQFSVNVIKTVIFNFICLLFSICIVFLLYKTVFKWRIFSIKR